MDPLFIYHHSVSELKQSILFVFMVLAAIWCIYILGRYKEDLHDWREQRVQGVRAVIACYWLSLIPVGGWLLVNFIRLWARV